MKTISRFVGLSLKGPCPGMQTIAAFETRLKHASETRQMLCGQQAWSPTNRLRLHLFKQFLYISFDTTHALKVSA